MSYEDEWLRGGKTRGKPADHGGTPRWMRRVIFAMFALLLAEVIYLLLR